MSGRIFIARHGQPSIESLAPAVNHEYPPGDPVLSDLGALQSEKLAAELLARGFSGILCSSPYLRTIYTMLPLSQRLAQPMHLVASVQEIAFAEKPNTDGKGWRQAFALYPQSFANKLEDDWVLPGPETREQVLARCGQFLQTELSASAGDLLIIGHGASTMALLHFMLAKEQNLLENHHLWNCALSEFAVHEGKFEAKMLAYTDFLADDEVSSNLKMRRDENISSA